MKIVWSLPVRGERLGSFRGDLVRARRLVEALRAGGHEVVVVEDAARGGAALAVGAYRRLVRRVLPPPVALALRDLGRWLHGRAHGRAVARTARACGADVIVETQVHLSASGALAARRAGCALVLDDCSPAGEEAAWGAGLPALGRRLFRVQVRAAQRAVVSSRALAERLAAEGVPREKLWVVPNGVERAAFARADGTSVRARLGWQDRFVVGFVGSFQPWHRVELLLRALARAECAALHALLVGDGPGQAAARAAAARLDLGARVAFPGAVPAEDVPAWTAACDVGVLPGTNDYGQPMKLLEYAAAAVPAVAPDVAPVREVLEPGLTGLLFAPGDVAALAAVLARLSRHEPLRRRLGEQARGRLSLAVEWPARARALLAGLAPRDARGAAA